MSDNLEELQNTNDVDNWYPLHPDQLLQPVTETVVSEESIEVGNESEGCGDS